MTFVHDPGGNKDAQGRPLTIDQLWAFVAVDHDGSEGVAAFLGPGGMWMPMVAADERRVTSLRLVAQRLVREIGKPIRLMHFSNKEEVERFDP